MKEGIFVLNKPRGLSSNEVLEIIRKKTGIKKIGHAGTLDPLATGVLVVGIGRGATKKLTKIINKEKEYEALICLGAESKTDDAEGPITKKKIEKNQIPSLNVIIDTIKQFQGKIKQVPPIFSAVKINGQEAYKRARRGERVLLKARVVEIKKIKLISYRWPYLKIRIITGPGVYVRALARDIGKKLGVGGYLAQLKRLRVGRFDIKHSLTINELIKKLSV